MASQDGLRRLAQHRNGTQLTCPVPKKKVFSSCKEKLSCLAIVYFPLAKTYLSCIEICPPCKELFLF